MYGCHSLDKPKKEICACYSYNFLFYIMIFISITLLHLSEDIVFTSTNGTRYFTAPNSMSIMTKLLMKAFVYK